MEATTELPEPTLAIRPKQEQVLAAVKSRKYDEIFLIGPVGSNKTFAMAYADICVAYQYAQSYIPVGRTTLAEARIGVVLSYLEVMDAMGLIEGIDYRYVMGAEVKITFLHNHSIIQFIPLDQTKDREWRKIKSINATKASVDEVDGVKMSGYVMLGSRTGRRNQSGAPTAIVSTCNPNDTWVKENIYTPYREGKLPPRTLVIEFTMEDSVLYKTGYYDRFMTNPIQWQQRYLYNNWDYHDDENSLFKSKVLDSINTDEFDPKETGYFGNDVAREGKDRSVLAQIRGNVLIDIQIYERSDLDRLARPDEKDAPPYTHILGREIHKYALNHEIGYNNTSVDAVGNGSGVVDYLRSIKFNVNEFKAGSAPIKQQTGKDLRKPDYSPDYDMLRSQMYHQLALAMERGEFKFYDGCPFLSDLKQELLYHEYKIEDKVMKVEKKDQIKLRLGKSPDIADAVVMAFYNKKRMPEARRNANRIAW